jgi:polysaccharide export outer membrane protein
VTVLEALALAGGFTEEARRDRIVVVRRTAAQVSRPATAADAGRSRADETVLRVNYKDIASGKDLSANAVLQPGDTVIVP